MTRPLLLLRHRALAVLTAAVLPGAVALAASPEAPIEAEDPPSPTSVEPVPPSGPDRSSPPPVLPPEPLPHPEPQRLALTEAAELLLQPVPGARKVAIRLVFGAGLVELDEGPWTTGSTLGWLWDVAAKGRRSDTFEAERDRHEVELFSTIRDHRTTLSLLVPAESLDVGLDMLADVLLEPTFPGKELRRYVRDEEVFYTLSAPSSPSQVAGWGLDHAWYPPDHPAGARPDLDALSRTSRRDLRRGHAALLGSAPLTVVAAGDISLEALASRLRPWLQTVGRPGTMAPFARPAPPRGAHLFAVDMPDAEQTVITVRTDAPPADHPQHAAFRAVQFALGGSFLSRLNANLREEHGYTYGISSRYSTSVPGEGTWSSWVEVAADNTGAALDEIRHELARIRDGGPTEAEIDAAFRDATSTWNDVFRTADRVADASRPLTRFDGLTMADRRQALLDLAAITPAEGQEAARAWLDPSSGGWVWFLVGDRDRLDDQLGTLGLTPTWLTPEQAMLGGFPSAATAGEPPE